MPNMETESNIFQLPITINGSNSKTYLLQTEDQYLSQDIAVTVVCPAAETPSLNITNNDNNVTVGTASDGKYPLTTSLTGVMTFGTAGWIPTTGASATDSSVQVGKINQSILKNGTTTINSGATVNPTNSNQTINISEGYNAARTVVVGPISAGPKGEITSGTASLGALTFDYNSTNTNFSLSSTASITAPTVDTAGYVSSNATASVGGTKNPNSNTVTATVARLVGTATVTVASGTGSSSIARKPTISKQNVPSGVTDAASGDATTTAPSSGVFVAVRSGANTAKLTADLSVTTAGYATSEHHEGVTAITRTHGAAQGDITYVPITQAATIGLSTTNIAGSDAVSVGTKDSSDYYPITATNVTATANVTVGTEGWYSGSTGLSNKKTSASTVGKMIEATLGGSCSNATATTTVAPGAVSISKQNTPSGITIINANETASNTPATTSPTTNKVYAVVKATAAANTNGTTSSISGTGTATVSRAGYAPNTLTGSVSVSGTATAKTSEANSSITYVPIRTTTLPTTTSGSATTNYTSKATITRSTSDQYINIPQGYNTTDSYYKINGVSNGTIGVSSTDPGTGYTENTDAIIPAGGYLTLTAGYYNATKISMDTLLHDSATITGVQGVSSVLLSGYTAYDTNGNLLSGSIATYGGAYTVTVNS